MSHTSAVHASTKELCRSAPIEEVNSRVVNRARGYPGSHVAGTVADDGAVLEGDDHVCARWDDGVGVSRRDDLRLGHEEAVSAEDHPRDSRLDWVSPPNHIESREVGARTSC